MFSSRTRLEFSAAMHFSFVPTRSGESQKEDEMKTRSNGPWMSRTTKKWLGIIGVLVVLHGVTLGVLIHTLHVQNGPHVTWNTVIDGKEVSLSYFEKSPTHGSIDVGHFDTLEVRAYVNLGSPAPYIDTMYIVNYPGRVVTTIGRKNGKAPVILRGAPVSEEQISDATALITKVVERFRHEQVQNSV